MPPRSLPETVAATAGALGSSGMALDTAGAGPSRDLPDPCPEPRSNTGGLASASSEADAYKLYIVQELCNGGSLRNALSEWHYPRPV